MVQLGSRGSEFYAIIEVIFGIMRSYIKGYNALLVC